MKILDLFNGLALKAGIPIDNEELKILVGNGNLANVDVPDTLANAINTKLLTEESAKNNSGLLKHFRATTLGPYDEELVKDLDSLLSPEQIAAIRSEANSYNKPKLLIAALKEAREKQASAKKADDPEAEAKYKAEIAKLNLQIKEANDSKVKAEQEVENRIREFKFNMLIDKHMNEEPWSDTINPALRKTVYNQAIQEKLKSLGATAVLKGDNEIDLVNAEGLEVYENNNKVTYKDLSAKAMAEYGLQKVATQSYTKGTITADSGKGHAGQSSEVSKHTPLAQDLANKAFAELGVKD